MSLTALPEWNTLSQLAEATRHIKMRDQFAEDNKRAERYSLEAAGLHLDYSKNRINDAVLEALMTLVDAQNVEKHRDAMFAGDVINTTEQRPVLHTALRNRSDEPVVVDGQDVMPEVTQCLKKMRTFVNKVHNNEHLGFTGKPITHVVSIGIGGSFLGPKIMTEALKPYWVEGLKVIFVANIDGCHLLDVLKTVPVEQTLFVTSSKSFSTQETLQNTLSARDWFIANGGSQNAIGAHFIAVSSNIKAATEFGIVAENIFPMWDWVGGRYSLWSAIGLPIALALGFEHFDALLEGAYDMDVHFKTAPPQQNMPILLAMLGIWYRHFFAASSQVLLPYSHYLRGLPAYVQQLDMESNGKQVTLEGNLTDYETGPIIWGSEGTNGQHSFHQLIHQGAGTMPVDFIFPLTAPNSNHTHHAMLASNCFGQAQAMMQGKTQDECKKDLESQGVSGEELNQLAAHKTMPGNKPSNLITFHSLNPHNLGALIALYEHKVFVQGAIWDINSFDQWGVELGKILGNQVLDGIRGERSLDAFDISTATQVARFRSANSSD